MDESSLKKTPFYSKYSLFKARVVDFFGWAMPVEFEGILKESLSARTLAVLFDASHMGEIRISGKNRLKFLQEILSNNISKIEFGNMQYNLFLKENGTIIDDCMVYCDKESFLCVVNASNKDKVLSWFNEKKQDGVEIVDESDDTALLSLQGPNSEDILKNLVGLFAVNLEYMNFGYCEIDSVKCLVSRSGYTGEDGFEIYCQNKDALKLFDAIVNAGKKYDLKMAGLGARDVLRVEAGYPLYGNDIDDTTTPVEASLKWALKKDGTNYIGKDAVNKKIKEGVLAKRVGFVMVDRGVARKGYKVFSEDGSCIGQVTSGTFSPNLEKFIGMAYIALEYKKEDTPIKIEIRNKLYNAKVKKFPFIESKVKKMVNL